MQYEQTRICSCCQKEETYMNHTIWQPDTYETAKPWAVQVEGHYNQSVTVRIMHEDVNELGVATFRRVKARSPMEFLEFAVQQLDLFASFKRCNLMVRPCDIRALYDGYTEGVENARARLS